MYSKICLLLVVGVALFVLVGCSENLVTRQHWDMIQRGKSNESEVALTLGETYIDRGDHWEYDEEDRHLVVRIHFNDNGIVKQKEWIDGKTGTWDVDPPEPGVGRKISDESSNTTINEP